MAPHTGKDSARSGPLKIDAPPPTLAQRILSAKETDSLQAFKPIFILTPSYNGIFLTSMVNFGP